MCVIEPTPVLETRRLRLRAPEARDLAAITRFCGEIDVARMTLSIPHPYGSDHAEGFLKSVQSLDPARERVFLIEHEQDGPAGMVGFHRADDPYPEIGYWVAKPFWGRGFATEAAQAAVDWAKRAWKKRVLAASHFADNPASGRVLQKCGFLYTGEVRRKRCLARDAEVDTRMMVWLA
ncbi:MAG TPA: GNAT family N-acetyltransferase [Caulobacteraceae bacterium]|jgi:RimJ/RimL family protein N-acetyltransferase|nr:GNAT family N-acetyltransferase [Caulobacteraceae bacterium]